MFAHNLNHNPPKKITIMITITIKKFQDEKPYMGAFIFSTPLR